MPFKDVIHPEQLAMLRQVLQEFCAERRIEDATVRINAADVIMTLFRSGVECPRALAEALRTRFPGRSRRRSIPRRVGEYSENKGPLKFG